MEWKDLAPWIAIAITLALSILVPLFTQMANNSHQRKMQKEKLDYEKAQEKEKIYKEFLLKVGDVVTVAEYNKPEKVGQASAVLHQMYIYVPQKWWNDLDALLSCLNDFKWEQANPIMLRLSKLIAEELNKNKDNQK